MVQPHKALGYFLDDTPPAAKSASEEPFNDTVTAQNRAFLDFCKREGYQVVATFIDFAANGAERPALNQLIDYLKQHRDSGCAVVVDTADRLGADPMQAARALFQIEGLGSRVVALDGEADPGARFIEQLARRGSGVPIGDRVKEAMRKKAIRGEVLGRPPYGYRVGQKHRLEPVQEEAAIVRYIFRLYTREGLGIRLIAGRLNEEGYRTRRNGNWSMITIRDILLNRAYLGTYTRFGVRVPGSHPAIISPDDYRRVQDRMASRRTSGGARHVRQFLLSGLAFCGYCGNTMIGVSRHQTWTRRENGGAGAADYRYYQCLSRTNQNTCDYHTRRADALEAEVCARAAAAIEDELRAPASPYVPPTVEEEVARLRERLQQLDRRLEGYMQAAASHQLTREQLRELSAEVMQEQIDADAAIGQLEGSRRIAQSIDDRRRAREAILAALRAAPDSVPFEQRRDALQAAIQRVTVLDEAI
ncbi:MAG TPA: recombinase family protein, partial [Dehalococcoidia bacterium]|nr:recombinase family protein [Dehalococcoidia bacterium]